MVHDTVLLPTVIVEFVGKYLIMSTVPRLQNLLSGEGKQPYTETLSQLNGKSRKSQFSVWKHASQVGHHSVKLMLRRLRHEKCHF